MTNGDLAFVINDVAGYTVQLSGAYAGWTLGQVEWWDMSGPEPVATGQSVYTPETMQGGPYTAIVTASNPDGSESVTLTSPSVTGEERTSYGTIFRDLVSSAAAGEPEEITVAFGTHVVTGLVFQSEFRDNAPNNIYVTTANGTFTEYQYDTFTGEQGYIAAEDRGDVEDWTYRTSFFQDGELDRVEEEGDNGVHTETSYYRGEITDVMTRDTADIFDYTEIATIYENGEIQRVETQFDDGVTSTSTYDQGTIQDTETFDNLDAHDYYFKSEDYRDGVLQSANAVMDDGRQITWSYVDGDIRNTTTFDAGDAYSYAEIHVDYNSMGGRSIATLYDDGRLLERAYVPQPDGTGSRVDYWRMQDNSDAYSWAEQRREYDENNKLAYALKLDDDGVETLTTYNAGVREQVITTDINDARSFTSSTQYYRDGVIEAKFTQMDDGRENEWRYDADGQLEASISIDTADAFVWAEQTRTYSPDGTSELFRVYDNGIEQRIGYEDGEKVASQRIDVDDVRGWYSITDQFEDGVRVSRETIWDDDTMM